MDYGPWSLLPPTVAIVLAILTRRVVVSLLAGVAVGVLILKDWSSNWNPLTAVADLLEAHLWTSLSDGQHLRVFVFTAVMGAMIGVIHRSGGMHGVVEALAPLARTRRGGQLMTWVLGLLVFIDDYANALLLGNTMRPVTDRLRISREKLAFLVDTTSAPVAGLALISTWVAGEIGYIEAGFQNLGPGTESVDGFGVFVATIPYRFYVLWALLFVPFAALLGRDFGPMLAAERRQLASGKPSGDARPAASEPEDSTPKRWINAVLPIFVMLGVTLALLLSTGARKLGVELSTHLPWRTVAVVFGNGNSYLSLVYGSLAGLFSALLLVRVQRLLTGPQMRAAAFEGAKSVIPALTILWLAWALSGITDEKHLGTGNYLGERLQQMMDVRWMPTLVFVLSSLVAFATGTSWGTMGILMPIVIGATYRMVESQTGAVSPDSPLLVASIGGVLAGAIFGDHCSPISDTTVLSAQASGCNLMAHVGTQLPYALVIALVSVVCGTLPVGFGCSVWPLMLLGPCAMILLLLVLGRPVEPTADRQ